MKECDCSVYVDLYFLGDDLDPDAVTEKLGVIPTDSWRKGEEKVTSTSRKYVTKNGLWRLSSDSDSRLISDRVAQLASNVMIGGKPPSELDGIQEAFVDIFVLARTDDNEGRGTCEFCLNKGSLATLRELGFPVQFEICVGGE